MNRLFLNTANLNDDKPNENKDEIKAKEENSSITDRLLKSRKIIISGEVNSKLAQRVTNQLLLLEEDNDEEPITIFINSPGGEIFSGFAIFDMMKFVKPIVKTIVMGFAASMGSIISLAANEGHRYAFSNSMLLIHQPLLSGVYRGSTSDIEIQAKEMISTKNRIIDIYVAATGKSYDDVKKDIDRDYWMTAEQAIKYGPKALIDKVITNRTDLS